MVVVLAGVVLLFRDDDDPVSGEELFSQGWEPVAIGEEWMQSVAGIEAMPDGGFVVAATEPWRLMWSPDGSEWLDGDPQQQLGDPTGGLEERLCPACCTGRGSPLALAGDEVVILNVDPLGVWVGDPRDGLWELIPLDAVEPDDVSHPLALAVSEDEAMVVAAPPTEETIEVWLVDFQNGTAERHEPPSGYYELDPIEFGELGTDPELPGEDAHVERFDDRWVLIPTYCDCSTMYFSTDGTTWTEGEIRWTEDATPVPKWSEDFRPGDGWRHSGLMDIATGSGTIVVASLSRPHASSEDGVTWLAVDPNLDPEWGDEWPMLTFSKELGFVASSGSGRFLQMRDGQTWQSAGQAPEEFGTEIEQGRLVYGTCVRTGRAGPA